MVFCLVFLVVIFPQVYLYVLQFILVSVNNMLAPERCASRLIKHIVTLYTPSHIAVSFREINMCWTDELILNLAKHLKFKIIYINLLRPGQQHQKICQLNDCNCKWHMFLFIAVSPWKVTLSGSSVSKLYNHRQTHLLVKKMNA